MTKENSWILNTKETEKRRRRRTAKKNTNGCHFLSFSLCMNSS
jgi:hypothetical protein